MAPGTPLAGNRTPGAVLQGYVDASEKAKPVTLCQYFLPSQQAQCRKLLATAPPSTLESFKDFSLGYTAIRGKQALVGFTGTFCSPGPPRQCTTNRDPAAILGSGRSFLVLWSKELAAGNSPGNDYSRVRARRQGGRPSLAALVLAEGPAGELMTTLVQAMA